MSTVTAEKPKEKQAAPLASFLGKLGAKPAEKAKETPAEVKAEVKDAAVITKPNTEPATAPPSTDATPKTEAAKIVEPEVKVDDKPKDDKTEKRLKDAQTWGNEEHKARLEAERKATLLEAQLARIEAKLDGTYEEPATPSMQDAVANAAMTGRIEASHQAAVDLHGEQFVMETVWNADSLYQKLQAGDPLIKARVMGSKAPVMTAIKVVKEHQDGLKYGKTPEEIRKNIEAELAPKLKQDILEGLKAKPGPPTNTLGNVRGGTERTANQDTGTSALNILSKAFPHGAPRR